jgi:hypothetical protein
MSSASGVAPQQRRKERSSVQGKASQQDREVGRTRNGDIHPTSQPGQATRRSFVEDVTMAKKKAAKKAAPKKASPKKASKKAAKKR